MTCVLVPKTFILTGHTEIELEAIVTLLFEKGSREFAPVLRGPLYESVPMAGIHVYKIKRIALHLLVLLISNACPVVKDERERS